MPRQTCRLGSNVGIVSADCRGQQSSTKRVWALRPRRLSNSRTLSVKLFPNKVPSGATRGEVPVGQNVLAFAGARLKAHPTARRSPGRHSWRWHSRAAAGILRQARLVGPEAVARVPCRRHLRVNSGGRHVAKLIERIMQGLEDAFHPAQGADRRQDMRGIGPLRASCLEPAPGFAGAQEGVQKALGGLMGEQTAAKIVQQGEVKAVSQSTFYAVPAPVNVRIGYNYPLWPIALRARRL
jgi:hypothetical protein